MGVKKFVFCVLFFTNAINSAEEDNSDNKKLSDSTVEEDSSINKNHWNTRKWGSIYLLFPYLCVSNLWFKCEQISIFGKLENGWEVLLNFLLSGVIEYKYMFHKKWGINIRLNLNNAERIAFLIKHTYLGGTNNEKFGESYPLYSPNNRNKYKVKNPFTPYITTEIGYTFFSLEFAFEQIWKTKSVMGTNNKKIEMVYSSSFSPIGFAFYVISFDDIKDIEYIEKVIFTGTFIPLKIECRKTSFIINLGKIKFNWHTLPYLCKKVNDDRFYNLKNFFIDLLFNFFSLEFGINIINDKRNQKKLNDEIEN